MRTLIEVLNENNIELLDSGGGRKVAKCPFHNGDNTPSFTVYPNDTYFCFGCDVWGDVVKFLVDFKGMTFDAAIAYVGADYKYKNVEKPQVIKVKNTTNMYSFLYEVAEQYHHYLLQQPGAIRYLESRGLTMDTIHEFKLGYTDGRVLSLPFDWQYHLAIEAGILHKNGLEILSHRITIPNITEPHEVDFIVGRTVTNDKVKYLGIKTAKPLHGFYAVRHSPVIFLVEGQFDWITLRQWGYPAAVTGGTHLSRHNITLLRDKKIILIPDLDESGVGMAAMEKLKDQLGDNAYILDYSECRTKPGKLDISTLGESPGGKYLFDTIVLEQLPWIQFLSARMLTKWFPTLEITPLSLLT